MSFFRIERKRRPHLPTELVWENDVNPQQLVDFLFGWAGLQTTYRRGWDDRGATYPEWVFDHQNLLRVAVNNFGAYLKPGCLNVARAAMIAGNHEDGELFGDHTPHEGLHPPRVARLRRKFFRQPLPLPEESLEGELRRLKDAEEERAMRHLTSLMHPRIAGRYYRVWDDYRKGKSPEACFVRQLHTVIDCVRATLYKTDFPKEEFGTFFDDAFSHPRKRVTDTILLEVVRLIKERYDQVERAPTDVLGPHSE